MNLKLIKDKRGMEMWQLIFLILSVALLLFLTAWYFILNEDLGSLLGKIGDFF